MFTFLDLLVVVGLGFAMLSLLALCLIFLVKNKTFGRICLYVSGVVTLYLFTVAFRIGSGMFPMQVAAGTVAVLLSVGGVVLERLSKNSDKRFLVARILASAGLVLGFAAAFLI